MPRPDIQSRLDTVFTLRDMTLPELRQAATWRGLSAKGSRPVLIARIYKDMVELDGVVRFTNGIKLHG